MSAHIADDLPLLLTGDATRAEVVAAAEHLRDCDDCRTELVSAVVAHAALMSARRYAPEILEAIPESVRQAGLPNLDAVFDEVRSERSRRRMALGVAAVAASAVIGGTVIYATTTPSAQSGQSVALSAYDAGKVAASARVVHSRLTISATSLPRLDAKSRYEVWLTNAARTAMQPVGWIGENGRASINVPPSLLASYTDIEVSVQRLDAAYIYSGTSVLRGAYG